ncbi:hypothetical protein FC35_GL001845 [Limosilactobacillus coleohominis DSM 14060]|nr:hypothetical protein FC35_GL001845 [Limosilactobacillus coleohominis DSM 14060]
MKNSVDQANWQSAIHYLIDQALPNADYQVVCFHQSKSSESLYVDVLFENLLYQLRFAFHDRQENNPDLYSFNLRSYPHDAALIQQLRQLLRQRRQGIPLTYQHFAALSLIEKLGQFNDRPLEYRNEQFWNSQHPIASPTLIITLDFLLTHQLLVIQHSTKRVFLSESGQQLLDFYWDVADQYLEETIWDHNPRTQTPTELNLFWNA